MKVYMGRDEIAMITSYLSPSHTVLEWGSGGSTVFYSKLVKAYFSVEHDPKWFKRVNDELRKPGMPRVELFHVPVVDAAACRRETYRDYIHFPCKMNQKFDRILIDGRARVACAEVACDLIAEGGVLFVHDYLRRPYYAAIEDKWRMIDSIDRGQTLAVFQKR